MANKMDVGSKFDNEGHDDSSIGEDAKLSKGEFQPIGSYVPLSHAPTSVNSKTGHTGTGEE